MILDGRKSKVLPILENPQLSHSLSDERPGVDGAAASYSLSSIIQEG